MRRKLFILIVSSIIGLAICEILVRLFVPIRIVGPSFTQEDSYYGRRLKANFSGEKISPEFTMRFSTNSLGFRGPEPRSSMRRGILFMGDSFTMGYGVSDGEEFPDLVRKKLADVMGEHALPVINTGMGDNGNGGWIKLLRAEGRRFDPRVVVLQLCLNDFTDNLTEGLFTLDSLGNLVENSFPRATYRKLKAVQNIMELIPGISQSYLVALAKVALSSSNPDVEESTAYGDDVLATDSLTIRILAEVLSLCKAQGRKVLAVSAWLEGERADLLKRFFSDWNVSFLAVPRKEQLPELHFQTDGHWNRAGHAFVADWVVQQVLADDELFTR